MLTTTVPLFAFWMTAAVLCYTHCVYPILMAVASAGGRRRSSENREAEEHVPRVTLIIPAFNESRVLEAKLENARQLDYPRDRLEVIVASDGSSDGTVGIARSYEQYGVRVLEFQERRGKAAALNDAVAASSGSILCLCDANVMFRPDALRLLVARLADPGVGAATGDVRLASHESNFGEGEISYYRIERAVQLGESGAGSLIGVDGGMYVLRRELFRPLPPDTILDDFVISMRVLRCGKRVVYDPEAVATENGTPKATQEFRRRIRLSAGAAQSLKRMELPTFRHPVALWQYVSHKLLRWLGPLWLAALLVANAMLWDAGMVYQVSLMAQLLFYTVAVVATASLRFRRTRVGGVTFYFTMSHVAMAIGFVKGLMGRQSGTWSRTERVIPAPHILGRELQLTREGE